jgi:hypothetical protein
VLSHSRGPAAAAAAVIALTQHWGGFEGVGVVVVVAVLVLLDTSLYDNNKFSRSKKGKLKINVPRA